MKGSFKGSLTGSLKGAIGVRFAGLEAKGLARFWV